MSKLDTLSKGAGRLHKESQGSSQELSHALKLQTRYTGREGERQQVLASKINPVRLTHNSTCTDYVRNENNTYNLVMDQEQVLSPIGYKPLPQGIQDMFNSVECDMSMGLFSAINSAWVSIDNRLYVWNYYNDSKEEVFVFDSVEQVIVSVHLARPKPGVFGSKTDYVVLISTPVEVLVLKVDFDKQGLLSLLPTQYRLSTDQVPMLSLTSTAEGRVFMGGNDGTLYEFHYELPDQLWHSMGIKRHCRKIDR